MNSFTKGIIVGVIITVLSPIAVFPIKAKIYCESSSIFSCEYTNVIGEWITFMR